MIGGWLPAILKKHTHVKRALQTFDGIYVETTTMQKALEQQGFTNVNDMPNCKRLDTLSETRFVCPYTEPYPLCTFSRVMREKGIEDAVNAIQAVNEKKGRIVYSLDIYGQVDSAQTVWFEELKNRFPECVRYCGCVDSNKSVEVLKNYYALLFPTHFYTEGMLSVFFRLRKHRKGQKHRIQASKAFKSATKKAPYDNKTELFSVTCFHTMVSRSPRQITCDVAFDKSPERIQQIVDAKMKFREGRDPKSKELSFSVLDFCNMRPLSASLFYIFRFRKYTRIPTKHSMA